MSDQVVETPQQEVKEQKEDRITAEEKTRVKKKNPNRVAAGKRAAEISRKNGEDAKREMEREEAEEANSESTEKDTSHLPLISGGVVAIALLGGTGYYLYYYKGKKEQNAPRSPKRSSRRINLD